MKKITKISMDGKTYTIWNKLNVTTKDGGIYLVDTEALKKLGLKFGKKTTLKTYGEVIPLGIRGNDLWVYRNGDVGAYCIEGALENNQSVAKKILIKSVEPQRQSNIQDQDQGFSKYLKKILPPAQDQSVLKLKINGKEYEIPANLYVEKRTGKVVLLNTEIFEHYGVKFGDVIFEIGEMGSIFNYFVIGMDPKKGGLYVLEDDKGELLYTKTVTDEISLKKEGLQYKGNISSALESPKFVRYLSDILNKQEELVKTYRRQSYKIITILLNEKGQSSQFQEIELPEISDLGSEHDQKTSEDKVKSEDEVKVKVEVFSKIATEALEEDDSEEETKSDSFEL